MKGNILKVVTVLAIGAALVGCKAEGGKAREAAKPLISATDGNHDLTKKQKVKLKTLQKVSRTSCTVHIVYDVPDGRPGRDAVVLKKFTFIKGSMPTLDLRVQYSFNYLDDKGRRVYKKDQQATSIITTGCPAWFKR